MKAYTRHSPWAILVMYAALWGLSASAKAAGSHPALQYVSASPINDGAQPRGRTHQGALYEASVSASTRDRAGPRRVRQGMQNPATDDAEAAPSLLQAQSLNDNGILRGALISSDGEDAATGPDLEDAAPTTAPLALSPAGLSQDDGSTGTVLAPPKLDPSCLQDQDDELDLDLSEATRRNTTCTTLRESLHHLDCNLYSALGWIAPENSESELAMLLDDVTTNVTLLLPTGSSRYEFSEAVLDQETSITPEYVQHFILQHVVLGAFTMDSWLDNSTGTSFPTAAGGQLSLEYPGKDFDKIRLSLNSFTNATKPARLVQADWKGCAGDSVVHIITQFLTDLPFNISGGDDISRGDDSLADDALTDDTLADGSGTDDIQVELIIGVAAIAVLAALCCVLCCLYRKRRQRALLAKGGPIGGTVEAAHTSMHYSNIYNDQKSRNSQKASSISSSEAALRSVNYYSAPSNPTTTVEVFSSESLGPSTVSSQRFIMHEPCDNADDFDRKEYLSWQLDSLMGDVALGHLVFQEGVHARASGGQAVVQFATNKFSKEEVAIKFFLSTSAFEEEVQQYSDADSPLRAFLPQCRGIHDNADGSVVDGNGRPLPPCIVMEKGESLDMWARRNNRDMDQFTCMQIIHHICEVLVDLHAAGYVHRDLKPANIMWLPSQNRWTLIDFGCAARIGEPARAGFTLTYAAPEAVRGAFRDHVQTIEASTALDAWSLGVLAMELFTGRPVLVSFLEGKENIIARIVGEKQLPWEEEGKARQMLKRAGRFKDAVLGLLHRDPSQRALVQTFMQQYASIMATTTQQETHFERAASRQSVQSVERIND